MKAWLNFNPSRKRLEDFLTRCAQSVPPGGRVLDAGAGETYYRALFSQARYHAADFAKVGSKVYGRLDYVCDLANIPAQDGVYDVVLCTQVLEHLPEPRQALEEIYRVLKPGGRLWFSAPLFFPEHEIPFDFFRYTRYGLEHLLRSAGFRVCELEGMEGYYGALSFQLREAFRSLPSERKYYGPGLGGVLSFAFAALLKPLFFALSLFFARLEMRARFTRAGLSKNYCGVAEKPL